MFKRVVAAAVAVCCACWLAWASLRVGAARFVAEHALRTRDARGAELASGLAPTDADAHFARAWLLSQAGDSAGALRSYERALALRPRDHVLWLEAGKERERAGDAAGALASLREAVRLAPYYARPRWQLGNALLRAGRLEEARTELRRAAESDRTLYPNFIEAEWHASGGDPSAFVRNSSHRTNAETIAVVKLLIREGEARAGLNALRESGAQLTTEERRALVADFVVAGEFKGAYEVWSEGRGAAGSLNDGGFEEGTRSDEEGFGWRFARDVRNVRLSLDADAPREGARSLKVEYAGASDAGAPAVSRLVAVEPGARYRLAFAARAKELVTGGPPYVEVVSAAKSGETLAQSSSLSESTDGWQQLAVEFTAPEAAAVRVALKRRPCASAPCPAFGAVWLDAFELRRLKR
ncbi:MAG TPA: tetratricopeptide repeat protein [Pyrinomonadaceae bacterium]